ncbi:hypothetical protein AC579_4578 [Pseudocercospora musae]|uniref:Uncharacterized protein n=1 Tax=Pseudocercospora musae TaxID=113226 RepID=A0A139ITR0_9PEZI|nr:hypothetical protein AC579_4578 [Pseudocercospora musae]
MAVTFERTMNAPLFNDHAVYHESVQHQDSRSPPWESNRNNVVQVPFMRQTRSPMRDAKHQEVLEVAAVETPDHISRGHQVHGLLTPQNDVLWGTNRSYIPPAPMSTPPRHTAQSPYESIRIPQGPKSAPQVPAFVNYRADMPQNYDPRRTFNTSPGNIEAQERSSIAAPQIRPAPALPGTMAARQQEYPRGRSGAGNFKNKAVSPSFAKRFMSSFKNMFKRDPVCEAEFERIEERHWSE